MQDKLDLCWGGQMEPCALATLNSLGAINQSNNEALSAELAGLFDGLGIPGDRCASGTRMLHKHSSFCFGITAPKRAWAATPPQG